MSVTYCFPSSEDGIEVAVIIESHSELWQPGNLEHEDVLTEKRMQLTHTHWSALIDAHPRLHHLTPATAQLLPHDSERNNEQ